MIKQREDFGIVYMGTPDFAVPSLDALHQAGYKILAVVTATDKPAGRGQKITYSAVKEYALAHGLPVFQPAKLKAESFLNDMQALQPDLGVVVAFRMLPKQIWSLPRLGTINLHASLLPQYRGAAPINRAVMNGETESGVTTFFLRDEIDTGPMLMSEKTTISENMTAGELHDILMAKGADLLLKTVDAIREDRVAAMEQSEVAAMELKLAPKIFREDCKIDWHWSAEQVHNHIRGLSPFPGAWTQIINSKGEKTTWKIVQSEITSSENFTPGVIRSDMKTALKIACGTGAISVLQLQADGKKRLSIVEFLRGVQDLNDFRAE